MVGLPPAAARQLTLAELAAYVELIEAQAAAERLAMARARQRHG